MSSVFRWVAKVFCKTYNLGMTEEEKRGPGRPKGSRKYKGPRDGAPYVTVRLDEDCYEWLKSQGSARKTLERLIRAEKAIDGSEPSL